MSKCCTCLSTMPSKKLGLPWIGTGGDVGSDLLSSFCVINHAFSASEIIGLFLQRLLADFKSLKAKGPNREPEDYDFSKLSKLEVGSSSTHSAINLKWHASWYHLMLERFKPPFELGSWSFVTFRLGFLVFQMKSFSQVLSSFSTSSVGDHL